MYSFKYKNKQSCQLIITGPRSVGKTTLANEFFVNIGLRKLDLDDMVNERLEKFFKPGNKTALEQAMEQKKFELIESTVRNLVSYILALRDTTVIAFAGGAYCGYNGISNILQQNCNVIGLIPFYNHKKSIELLIDREKNRQHFKRAIQEGKLTIEDLSIRVARDYNKVGKFIRNDNVDKIIWVKYKNPKTILEEVVNTFLVE